MLINESFGYFEPAGSGEDLHYKIQIEDAAAFNGGTSPNGKWTYVTAPDSAGRQAGFQGSGYYVYGSDTSTAFNKVNMNEILEFEIEVPEILVGKAMTFRIRASRDGVAAGDKQNDAWLNVIRKDGTGSVEEFLVETANVAEPVNSEFIKVFGGPNNGNWGFAGAIDGEPDNFSAQIAFPAAGRYVLQIAGRSQGFHIDYIELFVEGQNTNAPNSNFVPVGPQPVQVNNEILDQVFPESKVDTFDLPPGTFVDPDDDPITYKVAVTAADGSQVGGVKIGKNTGQISGLSTLAAGIYQVTVTANDADGEAADTFEIEMIEDGIPDAFNDAFTTDEDTVISDNVVANDTDSDGDPLTVTEVNGIAQNVGQEIILPSGALLTLNADGTFTYDPNGQFDDLDGGEEDSDSFSYTLSDSLDGTDMATVEITIDGIDNALPNAIAEVFITNEVTAISDDVLTNDTDPDGDPLTVTEVNGSAESIGQTITLTSGALLVLNADGTFTYDPNGQFDYLDSEEEANDNFTYTVEDGNGGSDTAKVEITINGNGIPEAVDETFTTNEDIVISDNVLANDTDPDGDPLTVTEVNGAAASVGQQITLASGAFLKLNADGTFTYEPNGQFDSLESGETASDRFSYTVSDGNGGTDTATVDITIEASDVLAVQPPEVTPFLSFESLVTVATAQGFAMPYAPVEVGGLNLGQFFDYGFYLNQNPDVLAAVNDGSFTTPFDHFVQFGWLEGRNGSILFNEQEYRDAYGDVDAAVKRGDFRSGFHHFVLFGHREERDPSSLFSQSDYLTNHPDVKAAVVRGDFGSAFEHYIEFGAREGREPDLSLYQENFYLANNLDVKNAVGQGDLASGFEHFVRFGVTEKRQPSAFYNEAAYLAANPDVDNAVSTGQMSSGFVHYALFGAAEGRPLA